MWSLKAIAQRLNCEVDESIYFTYTLESEDSPHLARSEDEKSRTTKVKVLKV